MMSAHAGGMATSRSAFVSCLYLVPHQNDHHIAALVKSDSHVNRLACVDVTTVRQDEMGMIYQLSNAGQQSSHWP